MCMNLYRKINRDIIQFDFVKHTATRGAYEDEIETLGGKIYEAPRLSGFNYLQYKQWWDNHFKNHPEHKIIHGHYFTLSPVFLRFAKKQGRITYAHCHAFLQEDSLKNKMIIWFIRKAEKYADICLACSREAGKMMFPNKAYMVLNNAVRTEDFLFDERKKGWIREKLGINSTSIVIGTIGRLEPVKNIEGIVSIIKEAYSMNSQIRFIWIGDGTQRDEAIRLIETQGISACTQMLGIRKDVPILLQAMDAFILPSISEGLPVTLIEAQAAGLRCFVSDVITNEVNITKRVEYLPLGNYKKWADTILSSDLRKINTFDMIVNAGYDVDDTARMLENSYLSQLKEEM